MKFELKSFSPDAVYSSALEVGDFVPHFIIENDGRRLDIQVKAGEPLLLVFVSPWVATELLATWLALQMPCAVYFISAADPGLKDRRLFWDAAVYRLFMQQDVEAGLFLCSPNLKLTHVAHGAALEALLAGLAMPLPQTVSLPPPVLVVPEVISPALAGRLVQYFRSSANNAVVNTGDYKSRQHLHPSHELELELDDKLCKSLLPEIKKVYFADIGYRETYKICCYDGQAKGSFGKHRDTISPHLHRRYAMTLILNDDYDGGGICFPEYSKALVQAPKYSAVIFPGSLYHQVTEIGHGERFVIVSFFFTEAEARRKEGAARYGFKVQRDLCDIRINQLWPEVD